MKNLNKQVKMKIGIGFSLITCIIVAVCISFMNADSSKKENIQKNDNEESLVLKNDDTEPSKEEKEEPTEESANDENVSC